MLDIGWMELMVIGVVALLVVGPRDLPEMFRQLGRLSGKLKSMAREFSRAMDQAANESGIKDVARDLNAMADPRATAVNSVKSAVDKFEKWDPIKNAAKPTVPLTPGGPLVPPPMPATPVSVAAAPVAAVVVPAPAVVPGPATQALYDKKAARKAILDETNARLKSLDAAPVAEAELAAAPAAEPAKPKRAPRKKKTDEAQS